jgi:gliding motility-associated-like protein
MSKKIAIYFFAFILSLVSICQTITPMVINSAGKSFTLANGSYYDNVGEPFVTTITTNTILISQGFLQPEISNNAGVFNVSVQPFITQLSCNKNDGEIKINVTTSGAKKVVYVWSPQNLCPDSSCASIDSLKPGTYQVQVKALFGRLPKPDTLVVVTTSVITIETNTNPCNVKVYNAVTLNNDNINDFFFIENIEEFPENSVSIYNRYGVLVRTIKGYNNKDKVWPEKDSSSLTSGTYFYIIKLSEKDTLIKGWVELLKN